MPVRGLTGAPIVASLYGLAAVEGPDSPDPERSRMYGQLRIALLDRAVAAVGRAARVGRIALHLASRTRLGPADVYAAVATARFMAAHELIERAEDQAARANDPDVELIQVRQPVWFGGATIHEENDR
ncbi:hypothetical protein [Streptomyces violaceusniger]|uniref:hypothetical protein n=1 Tax=Streptomyces violaceusniger TaxID=68280 RepID=UPI003800661B